MNERWSIEEVEATLEAYTWMLGEQRAGRSFVKAHAIRDLRAGPLARRTKGSIERRFQNYSWIFDQLGLPWVRGYVPHSHVGPVVRELVKTRLLRDQ